jgi:hypothetical protein
VIYLTVIAHSLTHSLTHSLMVLPLAQNGLDIPPGDDADDFDTNKMGQAIKDKLDAVKKTYDEKIATLTEVSTYCRV